ncbi:unnamed protein product [Prorocentrum cordatum]|uniref:Uncharacterized protein n=1 Tax=Prorocentrum cordatum TaxID=2364126 RepID=A0ABN9SNT6_9DINO|nr:unnamed protein product [Polarella glacialis]
MRFEGKAAKCLGKDMFRIHVFGLEEYAAVAYFDTDTQLTGRGDFSQVMRCAASKSMFISTSGPMSPLNLGFMAFRPSRLLKEAAVRLAQLANFNMVTGWGNAGFAPTNRWFTGAECGQGFVHTLLYKTASAAVLQAVRETGALLPTAVQVDRCVWNHQHDGPCKNGGCSNIRLIHKEGWSKCKKMNVSELSARRLAERFRCFEGVGSDSLDDDAGHDDEHIATIAEAIVQGAA